MTSDERHGNPARLLQAREGVARKGSLSPEHILRANEALKMAQSAAKAVEFVTGSEDSAVRVSIGVVLASLSDLAAILAEMGAK